MCVRAPAWLWLLIADSLFADLRAAHAGTFLEDLVNLADQRAPEMGAQSGSPAGSPQLPPLSPQCARSGHLVVCRFTMYVHCLVARRCDPAQGARTKYSEEDWRAMVHNLQLYYAVSHARHEMRSTALFMSHLEVRSLRRRRGRILLSPCLCHRKTWEVHGFVTGASCRSAASNYPNPAVDRDLIAPRIILVVFVVFSLRRS